MSALKERVEDILNKPMNRQEFLKQAGLLVLAVVGVTSILNALDPKRSQHGAGQGDTSAAYGASAYGGRKPTRI